MSDITIIRGVDKTWRVTVFDDAGARQLLDATAPADELVESITFAVRTAPGATGAALISKGLGTGITIDTQSGATLGQFTIALTPEDTETMAASSSSVKYYYDVFMEMDGKRLCLIGASLFRLVEAVQQVPA